MCETVVERGLECEEIDDVCAIAWHFSADERQPVAAQQKTLAETSVVQPTIAAMNAWWTPAETFGKSLVSKETNADNYKEKTQAFIDSVEKDVAAQSAE